MPFQRKSRAARQYGKCAFVQCVRFTAQRQSRNLDHLRGLVAPDRVEGLDDQTVPASASDCSLRSQHRARAASTPALPILATHECDLNCSKAVPTTGTEDHEAEFSCHSSTRSPADASYNRCGTHDRCAAAIENRRLVSFVTDLADALAPQRWHLHIDVRDLNPDVISTSGPRWDAPRAALGVFRLPTSLCAFCYALRPHHGENAPSVTFDTVIASALVDHLAHRLSATWNCLKVVPSGFRSSRSRSSGGPRSAKRDG